MILTEGKTKGGMKHFNNSNCPEPIKPPSGPSISNTNYMHVVPDSHFWTDLNMLKNYLEMEVYYGGFNSKTKAFNDILIGVNNTIEQGYELVKINEQYKNMMEDIYKLRDKYIGKKFTLYMWCQIIKVIKRNLHK